MAQNTAKTEPDNSTPTMKPYDILKDILKKPTAPIKLSPEVQLDSDKMLKHALEIFKAIKEGQIRKHKMAAIVMEKAYERYGQMKQDQLQQLDAILKVKDEIEEDLCRISNKCEDVIQKSIKLSLRVQDISCNFSSSCKLSKAEREMKDQLLRIADNLVSHRNSLCQLEARHEYVANKLKGQPLINQQPVILDAPEVESISKSLHKQSDCILDLVERVNRIKLKLTQDATVNPPAAISSE